MKLKKEGD